MTEPHRNPWLDFCRALAIALVLLSHGRRLLMPLFPCLDVLKFGGFLGVELFFVLSGFLIGRILLNHLQQEPGFSWVPKFWLRRWARTLPAYWFYVGLNLVLLAIGWRTAGDFSLWRYLTFTQNLVSAHPSFMPEAWSLSIEELFYFGTPLLMTSLAISRGGERGFIASATLTLLIFFALRTGITLTINPEFDEGLRKVALLRLDAIAIGLLLAWWLRPHGSLASGGTPSGWWIALGLICFLAAAALTMLPNAWIEGSLLLKLALFPMAGFGAAALIGWGLPRRLPDLIARTGSFIAAISYSAYLANLAVLSALLAVFGEPTTRVAGVAMWVGFLAGTITLSWLTRRLIEMPALAWRERAANRLGSRNI